MLASAPIGLTLIISRTSQELVNELDIGDPFLGGRGKRGDAPSAFMASILLRPQTGVKDSSVDSEVRVLDLDEQVPVVEPEAIRSLAKRRRRSVRRGFGLLARSGSVIGLIVILDGRNRSCSLAGVIEVNMGVKKEGERRRDAVRGRPGGSPPPVPFPSSPTTLETTLSAKLHAQPCQQKIQNPSVHLSAVSATNSELHRVLSELTLRFSSPSLVLISPPSSFV